MGLVSSNGIKIHEKISEFDNDSNFINSIYIIKSCKNLTEFQDFCINEAAAGITIYHLSLNGAISIAILSKANSKYLSFIHLGYGINASQYKYLDGSWSQIVF